MANETKNDEQPKGPVATPSLSGVAETVTERSGSGPHVLVKHTVVGRYTEGSIVPAETLPAYSGIDTTADEVRHAVDLSDTFSGGPLPDEPRLPSEPGESPHAARRGRGKE
jgi:hypothetical protein